VKINDNPEIPDLWVGEYLISDFFSYQAVISGLDGYLQKLPDQHLLDDDPPCPKLF
jgi:hypothetical protein